MERQGSVWADGPLEPFRDGVVEALSALGYSKDRAAQLVRLMTHLSRWLESRGLGPGDLSPEVSGEFFDGFRSRHSWCRSPRSLAPVLAYLRSVGAVPVVDGSRAGQGAGAVLVEDLRSTRQPGSREASSAAAAMPVGARQANLQQCHVRVVLQRGRHDLSPPDASAAATSTSASRPSSATSVSRITRVSSATRTRITIPPQPGRLR